MKCLFKYFGIFFLLELYIFFFSIRGCILDTRSLSDMCVACVFSLSEVIFLLLPVCLDEQTFHFRVVQFTNFFLMVSTFCYLFKKYLFTWVMKTFAYDIFRSFIVFFFYIQPFSLQGLISFLNDVQ